ncbi:MAG: sigma 54-interacting transcriptional regulator [Desulfobacterales bacterium]|nr:sigma 54-interacting transcriptional regulator [Desulfobacterales bacterium]
MIPHQFVQEITLRICSSLDIEKGMQASLNIIKKAMPADELMLHFYDPELDCLRIIARANPERAVLENRPVLLPGEMDLVKEIKALPRAGITNTPGTSKLNDSIMAAYHMPGHSLLQMFLETREQKYGLGHITLCAKGENRYTEEDLKQLIRVREPFTIATINALHHLKILKAREDLEAENISLRQELSPRPGGGLIGEETGLKGVMEKIRQVAGTDTSVLITGETGVGKEMVANRIHALSHRQDKPLIKFNCGAIPDTLVDSELFGHEKGAFSGAVARKQGKFERAHRGTLFLDEVGELSPTAQVRLLRVLQNGEIERVGGTRPIHTSVRIIAATNRDLGDMVAAGTFRKDLWFRLNVFPVNLRPLRERQIDIPLLTRHFIRERSSELNLPVIPFPAPETLPGLMEYPWPGNVRELKNVIERALILNNGEDLVITPLGTARKKLTPVINKTVPDKNPQALELNQVIAAHIEKVLALTRGKIHGPGGAAEILNINAGTLRHRMKRLGISFGRKRKA